MRAATVRERFPTKEQHHAVKALSRSSHKHSVVMMWRTHSCVPRRHSCRRPVPTDCPYHNRVSRKVSTRHARVRAPLHWATCEKCGLIQTALPPSVRHLQPAAARSVPASRSAKKYVAFFTTLLYTVYVQSTIMILRID